MVSKLLNINAYESAKQINNIFSLGVNFNGPTSKYEINRYMQKRKLEEEFKRWELKIFILLTDYISIINSTNDLDEILQDKSYVEYILDEIFLNGTNEDKIWFWKKEKNFIRKVRNKMSTLTTK